MSDAELTVFGVMFEPDKSATVTFAITPQDGDNLAAGKILTFHTHRAGLPVVIRFFHASDHAEARRAITTLAGNRETIELPSVTTKIN